MVTLAAPFGPEFLVNTQTAGNQFAGGIATLPNGGFVIAWQDRSGTLGDSSNWSVKAQLFDAAGIKVGNEFLVNTETLGIQATPKVTTLANGNFIIGWIDGSSGSVNRIMAQLFSADGTKIGSEFLANTASENPKSLMSMTSFADGGFGVLWTDSTPIVDANGVVIDYSNVQNSQRFDAAGNKVGGEFRVNTEALINAPGFRLIALSNGKFVGCWSDANGTLGDTSGSGVVAQLFDEVGNKIGSEFLVNTTLAGEQIIEEAISLANGGFAVFWRDNLNIITAQIFDAAGNKTGGEFLVSSATESNRGQPRLIAHSNGGFVACWYEVNASLGDASGSGVVAQLFDEVGNKVGGSFLVNTETVGGQASPIIAALANDTFVVSWVDNGGTLGDSSGTSVKARMFSVVDDLPPIISSNGAGVYASIDVAENTSLVTTVTATDPDPNPILSYSIVGGADAALFQIDPASGVLTFRAAPNFEAPTDYGANNVYNVAVQVSDGWLTDTQIIAINVTNTVEAPLGHIRILSKLAETVSETAAEYRVNGAATSSGSLPTIATLIDGGWVAVWHALSGDGSVTNVFGQRFSNAGVAVGSEFLVNTYTTYDQEQPSIAALADGGWIVTWTSVVQDGFGAGVFGQRYNSAGVAVGGEFRVNTHVNSDQGRSFVASLVDGGWLVTWDSWYQDGSWQGIYGQRYNSNGQKVGNEFQVNTYTTDFQTGSSIAALADGGWVITWDSWNQTTPDTGYDVYGQRYNLLGEKVGAEFRVNSYTSNSQVTNSIAALIDGGWVVTWTSYLQEGDALGDGIYGQRFDNAGIPIGDEFHVNTITIGSQYYPRVTGLPDGGWLVTWGAQQGPDSSNDDVFGQRYDSSGQPVGGEFLINSYTAGSQSAPTVASFTDGGWVVAWMTNGQGADGIYSQRFDANGNRAFTYTTSPTLASSSDFIEDKVLFADASLISNVAGWGAISWQWQRSIDGGGNWTDIPGATSDNYKLNDADVNNLIRLQGAFTNGEGVVERFYSSVSTPIINVNDAPVGFAVSISGSEAGDGDGLLTAIASVAADADGLPDPLNFSYQWQSSINGDTWINIDGATSSSFTPGNALTGLQLRVVSTYTDSRGTVESVTNINRAPVIISKGAGLTTYFTIAENTTEVTTVLATDPDPHSNLTFSISGGAEASMFDINPFTGALSFKAAPNFEAPTDGGYVNVYDVEVQVSDGALFDTQAIAVTVANIGEGFSGLPRVVKLANGVVSLPAPEFRVNTFVDGAQHWSSVAGLSDGGWVVAWTSDAQDGFGPGIYAQRYFKNGQPNGPEVRVNSSVDGGQYSPEIKALPDGGWIVVWTSTGYQSLDVFGQRYAASGAPVGSEFLINSTTYINQYAASLAVLKDGGWVVTWVSETGGYGDIFGRVYAADGTAKGEEFKINTNFAGHQYEPSVAATADGGWIVVWVSYDGYGTGIFGQKYDANGHPSGSEFQINANWIIDQNNPQVIGLTDGSWIVAWHSQNFNDFGSVYGRQFDASGNAISYDFLINTYQKSGENFPALAALSDGGWIATWISGDQEGINSAAGVYGQRFNSLSRPVGGEFQVNTYTAGNQSLPAITALQDGGWLVTWESDNQDGSGLGVFAQRFDSAGRPAYTRAAANSSGTNAGSLYTEANLPSDFSDGKTLYADASLIVDPDGLGTISWQWQRSLDGGLSWFDIPLATGTSYTLVNEDIDNRVRLKARYIDGNYTETSVYSNASPVILNAPNAPVVASAIPDQTSLEDTAWSYVVPAGTFSDVDGDILSYIATLDDGTALPSWLAFDAATQSFSGMPPQNYSGTLAIKVTASDGSLIASDTFLLTISGRVLYGTQENDVLAGAAGNDTLVGGAGDDTLVGGAGFDSLDGGTGNDLFILDRHRSSPSIFGGDGFDTIQLNEDPLEGSITGPLGPTTVFETIQEIDSVERIVFNSQAGHFIASSIFYQFGSSVILNSVPTLVGGAGSDIFTFGAVATSDANVFIIPDVQVENWYSAENAYLGNDFTDRIALVGIAFAGGPVKLMASEANAAAGIIQQLNTRGSRSAELIGSAGRDVLIANGGTDILRGNGGDDILEIGNGANVIDGDRQLGPVTSYTGAGSLFDGGDGKDFLSIRGTVDFQGTLQSIEGIVLQEASVLLGFGGGWSRGPAELVISGARFSSLPNNLDLRGKGTISVNLDAGNAFYGSGYIFAAGADIHFTVNGSAGADTVVGTVRQDLLVGNAGNDRLEGSAGDDTLIGGDGEDILVGQAGSDILSGGAGVDILEGGAGDDTLDGGDGDDVVFYQLSSSGVTIDLTQGTATGGDGIDTLISIENAHGSQFGDVITLGASSSYAFGEAGDDLIVAGLKGNYLSGGLGNDTLNGGGGGDSFEGGQGDDLIDGGSGSEWDVAIFSGRYSEYVITRDPNGSITISDTVSNRDGVDVVRNVEALRFDGSNQLLNLKGTFGSSANDILIAGAGDTSLRGREGNDILIGGAGNNYLNGESGDDFMDGGDGFDRVSYFAFPTDPWFVPGGVTLDLSIQGAPQNTGHGFDTLINIEHASGTFSNDVIIGSSGANSIDGYLGDDSLSGGAGDDVLNGGPGTDLLSGDAGSDTASYRDAEGAISADLALGTSNGAFGIDTFVSIENLSGSAFGDALVGDDGANILAGDAGSDTLFGGGGNDLLLGAGRIGIEYANGNSGPITRVDNVRGPYGTLLSDGANILSGGAGNDTITGGSRADIAVYSGNRANYTITTVAGVTTVVDNRAGSPDGTDTLRGLNILRFADVQLFQTTAANKVTLAGQAQIYNVSNSEAVQGTNAVEQFVIAPRTSALVFVGTNDVVDLSGAIDSYSYTRTGAQLQISDGSYTTTLNVGGSFTLRTASGSTSVAIDFAPGANGAIKLGGTQTVGTPTFNALAAITNSSNVSQNSVPVASTPVPTVEALSTLDKTPTLTGSVTLAEGQTLEVIVNGVTYTTATGVVVGSDNRWSLNLPNDLPQGTYDVTARIVPTNPAPAVAVAGTSGADTLSGIAGSVSAITGGAGNDTITGASRADIAVYSGNRANYTITTVAGVTTVVDTRAGSPDGTDTLRGLNILRFADVQLFQTTAANKVTLAGQAQTYNVSNSEAVQGTNAAEQFIIAPRTSALVFVGTNDVVDLSGAIDSYSYTRTGAQLQISDGTYTTTLNVGGSFTLRTASGSTSVAIDFAPGANGAIKLGGTQTVGTPTFNALAAITDTANVSDNAAPQLITDATSAELTIQGYIISGGSTVDEGQSLTLSVSAQGVADGTVIPYTLSGTGIAASDIQGGLSGSFTVANGQGSITLATNLDRLTEGTEQLLLTLGGAATGTPAFTVNITDIGLTPVTVANGQSYAATTGKVDTFIIDANQSIAATIAGFEVGDVLEFANYSADLGVSFEQLAFGDSAATLYAGSVTINLTGLSNDSFGNEASFEAIYGVGAIGYIF